ncbi:MAG: chemotaxis protein CheB [Mucilaginibacter polytrichastri]|nr:chemotaxis protein CheB [Mucilaginibacter polytrichastri]
MEKELLKPELIAIGGSAGSLPALIQLLAALHDDFTIPLLVVLHRKNDYDSNLSQVIAHRAKMEVSEAEDKENISSGHLYLAPPNYHVLVEKDLSFSLDVSEKVHYSRPSIDVSFQSAAEAFGDKLLAILLSGANADGTEGLQHVRKYGGTAIVQHPEEAQTPFMPEHAIRNNGADYVLHTPEIAAFLNRLR